MESQKNLIEKKDWDCVIILDACRYDYFEEIYEKYICGDLKKVKSEGSNTGEWLTKTFENFFDLTYYSTNPYINSYGLSLKDCHSSYDYEWNAKDHFSKIVDLWDEVWNEELGGVYPNQVNEAVLSRNNRKGKKIIHYTQPHSPYLATVELPSNPFFAKTKNIAKENEKNKNTSTSLKEGIWKRIEGISNLGLRVLRNVFNFHPITLLYKDNLRRVLQAVSYLLKNIESEKIIITADHGQAFGEQNIYGHPPEEDIPCLVEVPWLEIK